jgi:predicted O-methyltransferase YrrM
MYNGGKKMYSNIRRNYIKSLPTSPLTSIGLEKSAFKLKEKISSTQFDPVIQEELIFYKENHYKLEDSQQPHDVASLLQFIQETENLDGDILELGTYKGGNAIMLAHFLKKIGSKKRVYACDTFSGLPYEDKFSSTKNAKGMCSDTDYESVKKKIQEYNVDDKIILIKGLFEETLQKELADHKFSLVFEDCDLYDASKFCLNFIYPNIVQDGIMAFDNYEVENPNNPAWGETKAVDEFCYDKNITVKLEPIPHIIKK